MSDIPTRREFTRVPVHIWGTFQEGDRELVTAEITTLSLRGCYATTLAALPTNSRCSLTLYTQHDEVAARITMTARIVRADEHGMGVEFTAMPPESYEQLCKLVLLSSTDPEAVEREIRHHLALKRAS